MGGFAWVTLVTNDSYSLGALVLANSLRRVNTAHQLVVLITPAVTEAMKTQLSAVFNVVKVVDVLDSQDADNLALLARPELGITFTKLHCWRLTEFDKCVFLDADTLVLQNSDELFEREELSAAPDAGWPDCFNSGVFVYKPSNETFNALIEFALLHGSFDGGDQGLLNLFFNDWATKDITKHLPFVYNMCSTATYSYLPAFKQFGEGLKIVHFIGSAKPWLQPFNTESGLVQVSGESQHVKQFVQLWWDIFCAHVHPSLSSEMAGLAAALASVTLGAPLLAEQSALEEHLRRQGWEQGNIDYMGKDSFSNIWQKICDTLASGSQPSSTEATTPSALEVSTTPVAPVAAPVFVSSVEMSPSGPIDTSPPASYVPVSSSKPTVIDSETEAASKAASAETIRVLPEPKSSVTEVIPTEACVTSSASADTSVQPGPATSDETPTAQDHAVPTMPAVETARMEPTHESLTLQPLAQETLPNSLPPTSPPTVTSLQPQLAGALIGVSTPVLQTTDILTSSPSGEAGVPARLTSETTTKSDTTAPIEVTSSPEKSPEAVSTPVAVVATEVAASAVATEAVSATPEITKTDKPSTTQTEAVVTPAVEVCTAIPPITPAEPILAPDNTGATVLMTPATAVEAVLTPPVVVSTETPTPPTKSDTVLTKTEAIPVDPIVTATPLGIDTLNLTSTIALPPLSAPLNSIVTPIPLLPLEVTPVTESQSPLEIQSVLASNDNTMVPVTAEPAVPKECEVPKADVPIAVLPSQNTQRASDIPTAIQSTPEQPQTPTVTEPTPPTSPPAAPVESPLVTKLQVETEVPATPPVESGASQPALATPSTEEPPVPPKRKGGSKASQETKNQKGGKQPKGKK